MISTPFIDFGKTEITAFKKEMQLLGLKANFESYVYIADEKNTKVFNWLSGGTQHIPSRPWLQFVETENLFKNKAVKMSFDQFLKRHRKGVRPVASKVANLLKKRVLTAYSYAVDYYTDVVPNAPSTVRIKGFNMPWYENGGFKASIKAGYEVGTNK
jgi:hypothetical protein